MNNILLKLVVNVCFCVGILCDFYVKGGKKIIYFLFVFWYYSIKY